MGFHALFTNHEETFRGNRNTSEYHCVYRNSDSKSAAIFTYKRNGITIRERKLKEFLDRSYRLALEYSSHDHIEVERLFPHIHQCNIDEWENVSE